LQDYGNRLLKMERSLPVSQFNPTHADGSFEDDIEESETSCLCWNKPW
jgi:hypothetical protein